jgi:ABC-type multidrug transport system ATPase subunit
MNKPAVTVDHLSLRYGAITVLNDLSFSIAPGSVLGVVGRNGAGKSSLLQCLLGLTVPQGGVSSVLGCPSLALTDDVKARLAIVLALAHQPDLLVFDEPVASLDPMGRRDFLRALFEQESLNGEAVTVVISSHLLEDLERVVTHVLFLDHGRVQLMGARDELAERCSPTRRSQRKRVCFTHASSTTAPGKV